MKIRIYLHSIITTYDRFVHNPSYHMWMHVDACESRLICYISGLRVMHIHFSLDSECWQFAAKTSPGLRNMTL